MGHRGAHDIPADMGIGTGAVAGRESSEGSCEVGLVRGGRFFFASCEADAPCEVVGFFSSRGT